MAPTDGLPPPGFLEKEDTSTGAVGANGLPPPGFLRQETISNPPSTWDRAMEYLNLNPWSPKGATMVPDEEGNLVQQPGLKRIGANITELLGSVGGGIAGTAGGTALGAPAGFAVGGPGGMLPGAAIGGYTGGAAGATAGYEAANSLNQAIGLRPQDPNRDIVADAKSNFLMNMAIPPVVGAGGKILSGMARPAANAMRLSGDRLASFLNLPKNLARSMSDTLGDYEQPFAAQLQKVPEIFDPVGSGAIDRTAAAGMHDIKGQLYNPGMKPENMPLSASRGQENIFAKISENVDKAKQYWGPKIDEILNRLPTKIKVGDLGISDLENSLKPLGAAGNDKILAGIRSKATSDVVLSENEALAKQFLDEAEFTQYSAAVRTVRKAKDTLGDASVIDAPLPDGFEAAAMKAQGIVNDYNHIIANTELSPQQVRSLKSQWGANARYDRATTPDAFEATRAKVYGDLSMKLKTKLDDVVKNSGLSEEEKALFGTANEKYSILSQVAPVIEDRSKWASQMGQASKTGAFRAHEASGTGPSILGSGISGLVKMMPFLGKGVYGTPAEDNIPFARLERGLGMRPHPLLAGLQVMQDTAHSGLRGAQTAGDFMSGNAMSPYAPIAPNALSAAGGIGRGLYEQAGSLASPQDAQAQEGPPLTSGPVMGMPPPVPMVPPNMPLPRSKVIIDQNPQALATRAATLSAQQIMQQTGDPQTAFAVGQKTGAEIARVVQTGNPEDKEAMYHALAKMIPGLFMQVPGAFPSEIDGKIDSELDGPTLTDASLHALHGGANSISIAKQIQAVNTMKIAPVIYRPGVPIPQPPMKVPQSQSSDSFSTPAGSRSPSY